MHIYCNYENKPFLSDGLVEEEEPANETDSEAELNTLGEEQKQMGKLSWAVYRSYWRAVGGCMAVSVLLSLFLMQGTTDILISPNCEMIIFKQLHFPVLYSV